MTGDTSILHYKSSGTGPALVILHGLLGSGDNWNSIAKNYMDQYQVLLPDLRNHGRSFHREDMSYSQMAGDVVALLDHLAIEDCVLVGHSMGAKVAMQLASDHPERVSRLVVVDSVPWSFKKSHDTILRILAESDISGYKSRSEIDEALSHHFTEPGLRYFLMKNIGREGDSYKWKMNIDSLLANYGEIVASLDLPERAYTYSTLFLAGADSDYVPTDSLEKLQVHFPQAELIHIANAGHWVHADQPDELKRHISAFLART